MKPYSTNQFMVEHKVGITPFILLRTKQDIYMSVRPLHRNKILSQGPAAHFVLFNLQSINNSISDYLDLSSSEHMDKNKKLRRKQVLVELLQTEDVTQKPYRVVQNC